jgi:hypothetical protein
MLQRNLLYTGARAARSWSCVDFRLNPLIAGTAGEYLTLVVTAVVGTRPALDYAHALAAVLTGWITYANSPAHPLLI